MCILSSHHKQNRSSFLLYFSVVLNALFIPSRTVPQPYSSFSTCITNVLFYPSLPSYNWPLVPAWTLHFTQIHTLHKLSTLHPLTITKTTQEYVFSPIYTSHFTLFAHLSNILSLLTFLSCHTACSFQITHSHSIHS